MTEQKLLGIVPAPVLSKRLPKPPGQSAEAARVNQVGRDEGALASRKHLLACHRFRRELVFKKVDGIWLFERTLSADQF
ncbi:hypothetical protein [Bosea sp. 685]|uniref:hypothetical protein n=1 Tax=Bosea sp. 685 TaxID=3080057 RepID=UPI002892AB5C|nr:hypothetical protein [Bosea sp. 685]WNJ93028.1 hypothetical protein RMR04_12360 [Bosea sp. 685]